MSLKQQRRPLPFLLYFSFFYGENVLSTVKIRTVALYWSNRNNLKRAFCWEQNKFWIEWIADCFSPSFRSDLSRGQSEQLQQLGPRGNNGGTWLAAHAQYSSLHTLYTLQAGVASCEILPTAVREYSTKFLGKIEREQKFQTLSGLTANFFTCRYFALLSIRTPNMKIACTK